MSGVNFNEARNSRLGYVPPLDGLRAVAIVAVMLFHLKTKSVFPGGHVGVDLFFVLSGFLITTLLLQEWVGTGTIALRTFYLRRALRLLPAMAAFVIAYVVVNLAFSSYGFTGRQSDDLLFRNAAMILTYGYNWFVALDGDVGRGLSHLWSLSVEEQFYLVWPGILLLALRLRTPGVAIMLGTLLLVLASASLPFASAGEWKRLYYGTDFRLQALMTGCLLGQLYVLGIVNARMTRSALFGVAHVLAWSLFLAVVLFGRDQTAVLFHGGHTLVAVCSGVLIVGLLFDARNPFALALSNSVLVYVGKRSYALYLWHAALNVWLRSLDPVPHFLLTVFLSLVAAELSYRLVEAPALALKSRLHKRPQTEWQETRVADEAPRAAA
jgi:peptidoglycan/LPS O-acetylase OafA/YrhL